MIYFLYSDGNSSYTVYCIDFTLFFALKRRFKKAYIFFYHYDIGTTLGEMLDFPSLGNLSISGDYTLWVNKLLHNRIFKFIARHSLIFFIVKTGILITWYFVHFWNHRYFMTIYVISKAEVIVRIFFNLLKNAKYIRYCVIAKYIFHLELSVFHGHLCNKQK